MTTALRERPSCGMESETGSRSSADYDILVVEDDEDCREVLCSLLGSEGYRVQAAASGAEALDALARMSKPPRFVLLDLIMPGMSGFEFLRAMRRAPALAATPVVVHSGVCEDPELDALRKVERWLRKPVTVDALLEITRELTR